MTDHAAPAQPDGFDAAGDLAAARDFFREQGYVVLRNAVPKNMTQSLKNGFLNSVKPFEGPLLRMNTTRPEKHNISEQGFMTNPLLDVHEVDKAQFPEFRAAVRDILSSERVLNGMETALGGEPVLVQTMYFESSRGTDPHFDSHIFDATEVGRLTGFWLALEPIGEQAGRFCVYPRSHLLGTDAFSEEANQAFREYEDFSVSVIQGYNLENKTFSLNSVLKSRKLLAKVIKASGLQELPLALEEGDAALFSSLMLHASLKPRQDAGQSRNSLTAHFIPRKAGFLRYRKVEEPLSLKPLGRAWIHEHEPGKGPYAYRNV